MSTIDEIKSRIDIVDLVSEAGVKLRHAGKNYTGFCPFHDNKKTPAFVIWPESGTWRCFGQCNEGGDIFKFVMKRENLDFKEALNKLAARAGVEVKEYQRETPQQKEAYQNLRKLLEDAIVYYRSHLFAKTAKFHINLTFCKSGLLRCSGIRPPMPPWAAVISASLSDSVRLPSASPCTRIFTGCANFCIKVTTP